VPRREWQAQLILGDVEIRLVERQRFDLVRVPLKIIRVSFLSEHRGNVSHSAI
jgi:hypothetical protein